MKISSNKLKKIQRYSKRRLKKDNYDVVISGKSGKGLFYISDENGAVWYSSEMPEQ